MKQSSERDRMQRKDFHYHLLDERRGMRQILVQHNSMGTHLLEVGNKYLGDQLTEHDFGRISMG